MATAFEARQGSAGMTGKVPMAIGRGMVMGTGQKRFVHGVARDINQIYPGPGIKVD